jgi:hypothetical protein
MSDNPKMRVSELFMAFTKWVERKGLLTAETPAGLVRWDGPREGMVLRLNRTAETVKHVPGFHLLIEQGEWPVALINPYGGAVMGLAQASSEAELIDLFNSADLPPT